MSVIDEDLLQRRLDHRLEGKGQCLTDLPVIAERKPDVPEGEPPGVERRHADGTAEGIVRKELLQGLRQTARGSGIDPAEAKHTISTPESTGEENRFDAAAADIEAQDSFGHYSTFQDNSLTFRRSVSLLTTPVIRSVIRPWSPTAVIRKISLRTTMSPAGMVIPDDRGIF